VTTSRQFISNRYAIVTALAEVLKQIDGNNGFSVDLAGQVEPKLKFWDEINEFPAVHLSAGMETRQYQGGGHKDRYLPITVRCYVRSENSVEDLEGLLGDIEFLVEENGRLAYQDRTGALQTTRDILISSIDTDEGVLAPLGVGEILLQVEY
jgi:hypothetical protein